MGAGLSPDSPSRALQPLPPVNEPFGAFPFHSHHGPFSRR